MAEINYYKSNNNKYLGTIDLSSIASSKKEENDVLLICLLDKSGSMRGNVRIFVKEIFPLILKKLKCDNQDNILITYDNDAYEYSGNAEYYTKQNLSSGGGNELYKGLEKVELKFDEFIKSNIKKSIRLLTISDGDIGNESSLFKAVDNIIKKIKNNLKVNSHAVRYFTSDSPPDTKGLSSMLKLNNVTVGKLIDIKADEENETNATNIANLFLDDGLDELFTVTSEEKNLYEYPWSEPSSELLLKKGKNFIWFEKVEQIKINNSSYPELKTSHLDKGVINSKNYSGILDEKLMEIKQKVIVLKMMNSSESIEEMNTLISNVENFEKSITQSSNNYFSNKIKNIKEMNFQNKTSNELASLLQENELTYKNENEDLKKNVSIKELFLCPKCNKKIPLFISFKTAKNNIYINFICLCENKLNTIELGDLLNNWNNNKEISSKCNSHSVEGKYCLKCDRWLCKDCITVHEDIKSSHKDLMTKIELILNNKCDEHNKKNKIGFCCTCYEEICSTCAGFFNDGHIKYTNQDKWQHIFDYLDFHSIKQFEKIVDKMNKQIKDYKNNQIEKLNKIIAKIENLKNEINNKFEIIEKNNKNLTEYYKNLFKTFIVFQDVPSYIINENTSKFQFNKNFFIIENESNNTFDEIARATLETFETCNLYQLSYYPEIKVNEALYELNTNNNLIYSIIQLKDTTILTGNYSNKKVLFYSYNFKKITELSTPGNVTCLCELTNNMLAIGMYNPNNIFIYDISQKEKGIFKEMKKLEGHSGKINSIIEINDSYLISAGDGGSYEIFVWDKKNDNNLQKLSGHSGNINCLINLDYNDQFFYFASCSEDKYIKIWRNNSIYRNINCNNPVKKIIQLKNKKIVCVDSSRTIYIFNENSFSNERTISTKHNSNINGLISLKDSRILTCSDDNQIQIFEPENYKCLNYKYFFTFNNNCQIKAIIQTENYQIISGDSNGYLKVWTPQLLGNYAINHKDNYLFSDSLIVQDDEKNMIYEWIKSYNVSFKTELLYRLTRDGDNPNAFHSRCDGKGTTIIFIKNYSNGYRFGGFTTVPWQGNSTYHQDSKAFVFSLNNRKKFPIKNSNDGNAVGHYQNYGPIFGGDTDIYFHSGGNWSSGNNASCNPSNYSCTVLEMLGVNSSSTSFRVSDFEVYLIK